MSNIGLGFDLIKTHQTGIIIDGSPFSVRCILDNGVTKQGEGATLDPSALAYDAADELRCLPDQIGLKIDSDTGLPILGDSAEVLLNETSVTIGTVVNGWNITIYNYKGAKEYSIYSVMRDKTLGLLRLQLTLKKGVGLGNKIVRTDDD